MIQKTHYPTFDVMNEEDAWDDHTQSIVNARLLSAASKTKSYQFLHAWEVEALFAICGLLMDDLSRDKLTFVVTHIDSTLHSSPGEGQRKAGIPAADSLIRLGLSAIEENVTKEHSTSFLALPVDDQKQLIQQMTQKDSTLLGEGRGHIVQAFFQKLMTLTIEAYCSYPSVWSEIGYAGPAYPRGYVRTQLGQLDPWEAKVEQS